MTHEDIMRILEEAGYEAYLVGGWVRDTIMGVEPKDPDITTNATSEAIIELFPTSKFVSATFHDVILVGSTEVATFRKRVQYSDKRRPDEVITSNNIEEDLARRDYTINAMAMDLRGNIIDPFGGQEDLLNGILRAVGNPQERINEHPVRILRAGRFSYGIGFTLDKNLNDAIIADGPELIKYIPFETFRDELFKGLMCKHPDRYVRFLYVYGILDYILPEVSALYGLKQNIWHSNADAFEHTLCAVRLAKNDPLVRLAVLLHDTGKVATASGPYEGYGYKFIGHEKETGPAESACDRLLLQNEQKRYILAAVRMHMYHITDERSARRFLNKNLGDIDLSRFILDVMAADKADRWYDTGERFVDKVIEAGSPVSPKHLEIDGHDIMAITGLEPSREVGKIISRLMDMVVENPSLNTREKLIDIVATGVVDGR